MHGHRESGHRTANAKNPLLLRSAPHAFSNVICSKLSSNITATDYVQKNTQTLWTTFRQRVHPFIKILFNWELDRLEAAAGPVASSTQLDDAQDALIFSVHLACVVSLTDAECKTKLQQSKIALLSKLQSLCEDALAKTNILCMESILSLKAMAIYIVGTSFQEQSKWFD